MIKGVGPDFGPVGGNVDMSVLSGVMAQPALASWSCVAMTAAKAKVRCARIEWLGREVQPKEK